MTSRSNRRAFTMLTVLWVLGMAGVLATTALTTGRDAAGAARNRTEWTRARWRALGCARRAQSAIDSMLNLRPLERAASAWRVLNVAVESSMRSDCNVALDAAGARLDINSATPEMLERLFIATGRSDARQIALDVVAMRDSAPVPDVRALGRLPANVHWSDYDSLLSVEPGRIALSSAPATVLQTIPGFSADMANVVVAERALHGPLADLADVLGLVSRTSGVELEKHFQEAATVAAADPDAWLVRSTSHSGAPPVSVVVEWRIVRQANHALIVRSIVR